MTVWAQIDLVKLGENYEHLKSLTTKSVFGVVKDNAYGHGAVEVARKLERLACPLLCVFSLREALELRKGGIQSEILIFAFTKPEDIAEIKDDKFIYTVPSMTWFESLDPNLNLRLHIEVNTGMNRLGLKDIKDIQRILNSQHRVEGIYTHFANPENIEIGQKQLDAFKRIVASLNHDFKWIHLGNAPTELIKKCDLINGSRFGMGMYGYRPGVEGLKPILSLYANIEFIDFAHEGETIGYDYTFEVDEDIRYATIPLGYADGFDTRHAQLPCIVNEKPSAILGKICMNQTMLAVEEDTQVGDCVEIIGETRDIVSISEATGISPYVLVTCLNALIERRYRDTF